jgi:hypothetical protein
VSLSAIPKPLREAVMKRDAGRCRYCGLAQIGQATARATIDALAMNDLWPRAARALQISVGLIKG